MIIDNGLSDTLAMSEQFLESSRARYTTHITHTCTMSYNGSELLSDAGRGGDASDALIDECLRKLFLAISSRKMSRTLHTRTRSLKAFLKWMIDN